MQGVGFRPHVYRLAKSEEIAGWVSNSADGVIVEAEGEPANVTAFMRRLVDEAPPHAVVASTEVADVAPSGADVFQIRDSRSGPPTAWMLPDLTTCADCRNDINDPHNRRFDYPFTNCTHCGPRFSIIRSLPYDRERTTMRDFVLCPNCAREYDDPLDRRFHAQPNACPTCGPQVWLCSRDGERISRRSAALDDAARAILSDRIVALKGLGGYHLIARAASAEAVFRLRERKHRGEKPFALMVPDLQAAEELCDLGTAARAALTSREAPIVLAQRLASTSPVLQNPHIAPGNDRLGLMLPYTPLHHLLLERIDAPIVATSGNLSDEPICTENDEARARLGDIADLFLMHDRPIERPVDDSVVQIVAGQCQVLRRSRGFAPLPISLGNIAEWTTLPAPSLLALGAHQKNTVALVRDTDTFLSQHIGDLDTVQAIRAFGEAATDLPRIYNAAPTAVVHDLHPDYGSTSYAKELKTSNRIKAVGVQHHVAHALSLMAETGITDTALAFTWDGTGMGSDGTIWGGECFLIDRSARKPADQIRRVGALFPFPLMGGNVASREPRRAALGLWTASGRPVELLPHVSRLFDASEFEIAQTALANGLSTHATTSAGRLFDGLAAFTLGMARVNFEAQAAMALEDRAWRSAGDRTMDEIAALEVPTLNALPRDGLTLLDWGPLLPFAADTERSPERRALGLHVALARAISEFAEDYLHLPILLTGGCFQNRLLTELVVTMLQERGGTVHFHHSVPPNDGGVSLGQAVAARLFPEADPFVRVT